ncbi:hypothetical protein ALI144C_40495 [Actinosynnema sp. ALI-1.44]|uniref:hypothetical protein n=1 Tax=Actinosynnema sp. ALI-1.44 TaxID=1933779 RepID=UPI00097C1E7C|nr:hypothetical protein [Actinosynnema sp. ALI-1.44]ONI75048.1 hypothetical protein ALI144C_40495 [Actinosynnema sp. ALI-1.44]
MKWLLWTQIALVVASLCLAVTAIATSRYGMMVSLTLGILPLLPVVGAVLGLIALNRQRGYVPAGIMLLAPVVWVLVSGTSGYTGGAAVTGDLMAPGSADLETVRRDLASALTWLNWFWWLNLAAAALGVVAALLLFRRYWATRARPSGAPLG